VAENPEYFSRQEYILLGGSEQYRRLYERFIDVAKEHLFFRPLTKDNQDILLSGGLAADSPADRSLIPHCQHLGCFIGGMVAMGAQIFERPADLAIGRKLMDGCVWAYQTMPSGIMPESFDAVPCEDAASCPWDKKKWFEAIGKKVGDGGEADKSLSFEERVRKRIEEHRLVPGISDIVDRRYILR
jgi:mannosyl-oligosaccharide alpha-1,2-mannosidase